MAPIPGMLPAGVEAVGYLADWDLPGRAFDPVDQDAEYMLTKYSLTPLHVVPDAGEAAMRSSAAVIIPRYDFN